MTYPPHTTKSVAEAHASEPQVIYGFRWSQRGQDDALRCRTQEVMASRGSNGEIS
jgi:hypothetical protein